MEKKKVLFILQSIGYGGSMTSLINLVRELNYTNKVDVEMLFMDDTGPLLDAAKLVGKVKKADIILRAVTIPKKRLIQEKRFFLLLIRIWLIIYSAIQKKTLLECAYKYSASKYSDQYDCVIAYQESIATIFVTYIKTPKKIAWIHNDYDNLVKIYKSKDKVYQIYKQYQKIVCVSEAGKNNFRKKSGISPEKIVRIYNVIPEEIIRKKAEIPLTDTLSRSLNADIIAKTLQKNIWHIVSIGRFVTQKRFDRVIEVANLLKKADFHFVWYLIGEGEQFEEIKKDILERGLSENVILSGGLDNPFSLISKCELVVVTSDFEAHPMVINEALILHKPVITTNYESAEELIRQEENGIICEMDSKSVFMAVKKYMSSFELREKLGHIINNYIYDNKKIIEEVLFLLNSN